MISANNQLIWQKWMKTQRIEKDIAEGHLVMKEQEMWINQTKSLIEKKLLHTTKP